MAFPILNSPTFPSVADVPGLPPKFGQMPIMNPGTHTYLCEDGITRVLTEEQAINLGISCRAIEDGAPAPATVWPGTVLLSGPTHTGPRYRGVTLNDRRVVRRF